MTKGKRAVSSDERDFWRVIDVLLLSRTQILSPETAKCVNERDNNDLVSKYSFLRHSILQQQFRGRLPSPSPLHPHSLHFFRFAFRSSSTFASLPLSPFKRQQPYKTMVSFTAIIAALFISVAIATPVSLQGEYSRSASLEGQRNIF